MSTKSIKRARKEKIITDLEKKFKKQKAVFLVNYKKLNTNQINKLRKELKQVEANFQVVKKKLIKFAFNDFEKEKFKEEVALVFGYKDEVSLAKIIYEFSKNNSNLKILGGYLENNFISNEEVIKLVKLDSREKLLEKLVFVMKNPIYRFVDALNGNTKKLIFVLSAIKKTKEG